MYEPCLNIPILFDPNFIEIANFSTMLRNKMFQGGHSHGNQGKVWGRGYFMEKSGKIQGNS